MPAVGLGVNWTCAQSAEADFPHNQPPNSFGGRAAARATRCALPPNTKPRAGCFGLTECIIPISSRPRLLLPIWDRSVLLDMPEKPYAEDDASCDQEDAEAGVVEYLQHP